MAYAFDKTMGKLGQKPEKADIFNGGMGLTDGAQPQGGLNTDTSGDLTGGSGGPNTGEAVKQSNDTASNAAVAANVGRVKAPANMKSLQDSVETSRTNLQNEANNYVKANAGPTALSADDKVNLRRAVDPEANNGTGKDPGIQVGGPQHLNQSTMGYWASQRPESVKTVDPFKSDIDLSNNTIEGLGTDAGVQDLLRRNNGPEYNIGDAAFDSALLSQDTGFQQQREGLTRSYGDLQKMGDEIGGKTTELGQKSANDAYGLYLTDLRKQLGGLNDEYTQGAKAREKLIEDQAQREADKLRGTGGDVLNTQLESLKGSPAAGDAGDYLSGDGVDASSYFNQSFNPDQYGWEDYLDEGKAGTFNNIMSLLDSGKTFKTGAKAGGLSGSDLGSFDTNRLQGDLIKGAQGRLSEETARKDAEAAAATAAAEQKAAEEAAAAAAAAEQQAAAAKAAEDAKYKYGKNAARDFAHGSEELHNKTNEYLNLPDQFQNPGFLPMPEGDLVPAPFRDGGMLEGVKPSKTINMLKKKWRI